MSDFYPWYDSWWLTKFVQAREVMRRARPEALIEFDRAVEVLRTRPDFQVKEFSQIFSDTVMEDLQQTIRELQPTQLELHEIRNFGRFITHDHPFVTELQQSVVDLVSQAAGEPVEPAYNFISLYTKSGVCPVHMDTPEAKWTLDLCVRQSQPWPIHLSQVVPWPEPSRYSGDDWQELIKGAPEHQFAPYSLEPGGAILFSGSSQWHYRDPHPGGEDQSCDLVFFHFVPTGAGAVVDPANWARLFDVPELDRLLENMAFQAGTLADVAEIGPGASVNPRRGLPS